MYWASEIMRWGSLMFKFVLSPNNVWYCRLNC